MMDRLTYSQLIALNRDLADKLGAASPYRIHLLSNAVVEQLKDIIEYGLRLEGVNAQVTVGNYDNIVQDTMGSDSFDAVMVWWEIWNVADGLYGRIESFSPEQREEVAVRLKSEVAAVFDHLRHVPLVVFNRFNASPFRRTIYTTALDNLCREVNDHLQAIIPSNIFLMDVDAIYKEVSIDASVDWRLFHSSKSLYTVAFYRAYVDFVLPVFADVAGKTRKVLIFDCDNTLWQGILGEEGESGISMAGSPKGSVYADIQQIALALQARGVLLGLCSKNNPGEVDGVLASHPDMQIRNHHLAIKKVNWRDKVSNLREIAQELNIGLDSMIFVDDSPFEVGLVNQQLPEVKTLLVPKSLATYPDALRRMSACFYRGVHTDEDAKKTEQYHQNARRKESQAQFSSLEEYLRSLQLSVIVHHNSRDLVARMAQLTQKTNQFNLTTHRYTESEIGMMMAQPDVSFYAFDVKDRYGEYGTVGLAIVRFGENATATLDSLLMSCRVIGRHVEYAFFNLLVEELKRVGARTMLARYIRTTKNAQVAVLYDELGFALERADSDEQRYSLPLAEYRSKDVSYIKLSLKNNITELGKSLNG